MSQQTEKICFRYDGSEEAKQCIEWINETLNLKFLGDYDIYYLNTPIETAALSLIYKPTTHRLVTPAEFFRIVSEPKWKVGDECCKDSTSGGLKRDKGVIKAIVGNEAWVRFGCFGEEYNQIIDLNHIRPIRKSVREEINEIAKDWLLSEDQYDLADRIIELIKQRKDEL